MSRRVRLILAEINTAREIQQQGFLKMGNFNNTSTETISAERRNPNTSRRTQTDLWIARLAKPHWLPQKVLSLQTIFVRIKCQMQKQIIEVKTITARNMQNVVFWTEIRFFCRQSKASSPVVYDNDYYPYFITYIKN